MAKPGDVISEGVLAPPTIGMPGGLSTKYVNFRNSADADTFKMALNSGETAITTKDSATDVEGRYVAKEALDPITNNEVAAGAAVAGSKLNAGSGALTYITNAGVLNNSAGLGTDVVTEPAIASNAVVPRIAAVSTLPVLNGILANSTFSVKRTL